uniref:ThiS n=1 Tax=Pterocladia lucida TaxID=31408 RepID=A0A6M3WW98_PTELU|nr:thiS [Pterocladia lucida]
MNNLYNIVFLNGKPVNCSVNISLNELLIYYRINVNSIIVEYNRKILSADDFSSTVLKSEDKIEIITIVGGG